MQDNKQIRNAAGRKVLADPRTHRYYLKLNDADNEKFLAMFRRTQACSAADFIRARIFGWDFTVITKDKNTFDFYVRLTEFYSQFRAIGNNYNQCVKAIHSIYGEKKTLAFLYKLTAETLKLEQLIKQVVALIKEFREWQKEYQVIVQKPEE